MIDACSTSAGSKGRNRTAHFQNGAAALLVTLMLFFAMVLAALFVNRNLIFEQRSSANQYRATQAFEAAEAGLEWAIAQLNANQRIGADCKPSESPTATSFRTRYISVSASGLSTATGTITPITWNHDSVAAPLQPACARMDSGWSCSCPSNGSVVLRPPADSTPTPAFMLAFLPAGKPGLVRVSVTGCSSFEGLCRPGFTSSADAVAHVEALLGLVQGLRTPPSAAITVTGSLTAAGVIGLHNSDPVSGVAVHAGGSITAPGARWTGPAGAPAAASIASNDATLAALDPARLFATHFGLDRNAWQRQPAVIRLQCGGDCNAEVAAAVASAADAVLLSIDGDLTLTGPLVIGTLDKPVLIVAGGDVQIEGAVALYGAVYGHSMRWGSAGDGAFLRGAVIVEGDFATSGKVDLFYDTSVLARLHATSGSFVRVSGSWRDF